MPTFSVIVPIYNAEKTLRKCLDSMLAQSYQSFEILMIENGSKDSSNAICREYTARDTRLILLECENNRGPSGARNIGLDHAKGEFIAFVDSDDFVEADYLETLRQGLSQADVVFFGYHQIAVDGDRIGVHIPSVSRGFDYYDVLTQLHEQDMFGYTWIKAFRRDVIGMHRFSKDLNLLEDEVFTCEVLTEPRRIGIIAKPLYNYVTGNAGSLVGRTHTDYCSKVDIAYKAWKRLLKDYERKDEVLAGMANAHVNRCMYYGFERDVDVKEFFGLLVESEFFARATLNDAFSESVKNKNYRRLSHMRAYYRLKNKVAKLLKR